MTLDEMFPDENQHEIAEFEELDSFLLLTHCAVCGALVYDLKLHYAWHEARSE